MYKANDRDARFEQNTIVTHRFINEHELKTAAGFSTYGFSVLHLAFVSYIIRALDGEIAKRIFCPSEYKFHFSQCIGIEVVVW